MATSDYPRTIPLKASCAQFALGRCSPVVSLVRLRDPAACGAAVVMGPTATATAAAAAVAATTTTTI